MHRCLRTGACRGRRKWNLPKVLQNSESRRSTYLRVAAAERAGHQVRPHAQRVVQRLEHRPGVDGARGAVADLRGARVLQCQGAEGAGPFALAGPWKRAGRRGEGCGLAQRGNPRTLRTWPGHWLVGCGGPTLSTMILTCGATPARPSFASAAAAMMPATAGCAGSHDFWPCSHRGLGRPLQLVQSTPIRQKHSSSTTATIKGCHDMSTR